MPRHHTDAGMAEWYTRSTQNRLPKGLRVRVPLPAQMKKAKVIVILGPTSSGKTALSIALAQKFNGEVVSADSRQVYRGLTLGTGKVTKKEMAGIPHHLLDVANPKKVFSVAEYKEHAERAIEGILSRGKVPIVCGGTGFYIDTLINGTELPDVPPNKPLRAKLETKDAPALFQIFKKLDPIRATTIDNNNPVRLIRAIEIATALGNVPKLKKANPPYETLKLGLDMGDETLKKRIVVRLTERVKKGMLREAKTLHEAGLSWRRMRALGLEYRHMADLLSGKSERKEFKQKLAADIWQYARRQRQWFKRDTAIIWLNPTQKTATKDAVTFAKKFLAM